VLVTASLTGIFAHLAFGLSPYEALLMGSIVGSTDAAAVLFLLNTGGLRLQQRAGSTLEIESSSNDPFAIFLTIFLVELVAGGAPELGWNVLLLLARQGLLGTAFGIAGGLVLSRLLNRLVLPAGLQPVFVIASALLIFALTAVLDGSGFLAVYLAGAVVGNRPMRAHASITGFHAAATWIAQIVMFLVLGLLVTPSNMLQYTPPAMIVAAGLMLVARPVAAWLCLLPFRFSWREILFVGWVGLRGAVSIFLASLPMLSGLPRAELYFNTGFVVVLVSLLVQGWTIAPVARRLGIALPGRQHAASHVELDLPGRLELEMVGYPIRADSPILHRSPVPDWASLVLVIRGDRAVPDAAVGTLRAGDYAYFLAPPWRSHLLDRILAAGEDEESAAFFGEFVFDGETLLGTIARYYDLSIPPELGDRPVAEHFAETLNAHPVVGDRLPLGGCELIVREVENDRAAKVGLLIEPAPRRAGGWLRFLLRRGRPAPPAA
jgi:cell volume regulation protein A